MAGSKNVLIVEDDVMIRELYRVALVEADYTVVAVGNAAELYERLANFKPDCVLLDIMLPNTSGLEILQELRTNPALGCTDSKIIMLTNLAQRSVIDNAMQNGADGYIIKADILPRDLHRVIESLDAEQ